jgi:hypothetical protein
VQGTRAIQVVLGEGEPGDLRLILEAQGFHVVGHARDDDELRRVIPLTHPTVLVLDAGISAPAVLDAQIRSDYVPIVVVWPKDTYTSAAEERVDPATAFLELGNAVRRVVERHAEPIRVPEADEGPVDEAPAPPERRERSGRARHASVLVAAWTIALTALAAIGLAVPSAFRGLERAGNGHPGRDRPERALTVERERSSLREDAVDRGPTCAARGDGPTVPDPGRGDGHGRGRGCAVGHGEKGSSGTPGQGHGRPDDPGKGSGQGDPSGGPPEHARDENSGDRPGDDGDPGADDPGSGSGSPPDDHGGGSGGGGGGPSNDDGGGSSPGQGQGSGTG